MATKSLKKLTKENLAPVKFNKVEEDEEKLSVEELLNKKIADTEIMLAKEKQETLIAIDELALTLATDILAKLDIQNINLDTIRKYTGDDK